MLYKQVIYVLNVIVTYITFLHELPFVSSPESFLEVPAPAGTAISTVVPRPSVIYLVPSQVMSRLAPNMLMLQL